MNPGLHRPSTVAFRTILTTRWLSCLLHRISLTFPGPVAPSGFDDPLFVVRSLLNVFWENGSHAFLFRSHPNIPYFKNSVFFKNKQTIKTFCVKENKKALQVVLSRQARCNKSDKQNSGIRAAWSGVHWGAKSPGVTARSRMRTHSWCPGLNLFPTTPDHKEP